MVKSFQDFIYLVMEKYLRHNQILAVLRQKGIDLTPQVRTKSVPPSMAKIEANLQDKFTEISGRIYDGETEKLMKSQGRCMYLVFYLQTRHAIRITEALQLRGTDIINNRTLLIRAAKGGKNKIVNVEGFEEYFDRMKGCVTKLVQTVNYMRVYRLYKQLGIYAKIGGQRKNRVTHLFRYIVANDTKSIQGAGEALSTHLTHRRKKTKRYYTNPKPKQAK